MTHTRNVFDTLSKEIFFANLEASSLRRPSGCKTFQLLGRQTAISIPQRTAGADFGPWVSLCYLEIKEREEREKGSVESE